MKKNNFYALLASVMLAATAGLMTACTSNDDNPTPRGPSESVIKEKIIGKWKGITQDGAELTTNVRTVLTFNADGTRTVSTSRFESNTNEYLFRNKQSGTYAIEGSQLKNYLDTNDGYDVAIYNIDVIYDSQLAMTMQNLNPGRKSVYKRVTADYSEEIIGLWEVTEMTGEETYNDDNARLAFLADGTYKYYRKSDAGDWHLVSTREVEEYNLDGDWLATRWQETGGEMNYEWWDINEIKDGKMKWSALRERKDGTHFTTTFTWKKVSDLPALTIKVGDAEVNMMKVKGGDYSMAINRDGTEMKASGTMTDFFIAQTEVTNKLWKAVMGSVPTELEQKGDEYPIALNSYNYLVKEGGFIDKLNEMMKDKLPTGKKFALPTEVEWHYAAMG